MTVDDVCGGREGFLEANMTVLMYDVRMQLVDVFRWPCPRGRVQRSGCHTRLSVLP